MTATATSPTQINLAWTDASTDETEFEIDQATAAGGPWTQIATVGANVTTYSNTGLTAATQYFYRVRATNTAGDSANSNVANATTPSPGTVTAFQDGVSPAAAYAGTRDAAISQTSPALNQGLATTIKVDGDDQAGTDIVALLRWDLGSIPAGSVVQSATITLNVSNSTLETFQVYEARRAWTEMQVTWTDAALGTPWQTPGAQGALDRGTTVLGTLAPTAMGPYVLTLNAAGVAVVQQW
ncbi:MAG: DNRLRE domain-containing protein, partial [Actinomycetota bacterium]